MNDAHIWWYLARASGLVAWTTMTIAVLWGILLSTRILRKIDNPSWLQDLHRYLGGLTIVMVLLHMVTLMLDPWLKFSVVEELVPFATDYRPLAIAVGIISFYILLAVQATSWFMNRLPRAFWKGVHYASYAALLLVSLHAGWSGTDVTTWWYRILAIVLIGSATVAIVTRLIVGRRFAGKRTGSAVSGANAGSRGTAKPSRVALKHSASQGSIERLSMTVSSKTKVAQDVSSITLVPNDGKPLPIWQPGSHITLYLPNGLERQYSLCGDPADRKKFEIAVLNKKTSSQGGSSWIHQNLKPGATLEVSAPRNHFELEPATDYLFIAGGIGITPIKSMIESLPPHRSWDLLYLGRSRATMAFLDELLTRYPNRVQAYPRDEFAQELDVATIASNAIGQVYCCGPEALMNRVAEVVPADRLHLERFVPLERSSWAPEAPVEVYCRKSKIEFEVPVGVSVLSQLEANGLPVVGSCNKGVCGTCEVRVVSGTPVHLDSVMDDAEKDALHVMYPCVSRATDGKLVLDL